MMVLTLVCLIFWQMSSEKSVEEGKWNLWNFFENLIFAILKIWLCLLMVGPRPRVFVTLHSLSGRPRSFAKSLSLRLFMTFDPKVVQRSLCFLSSAQCIVATPAEWQIRPGINPTKLVSCLKRWYLQPNSCGVNFMPKELYSMNFTPEVS